MKKILFIFIAFIYYNNSNAQWVNCSPNNTITVTDIIEMNHKIFIATKDSGVYVSNNNGDTWQTINTGITNKSILSLHADASGILYAGSRSLTVFTSVDTGNNWIGNYMGGTGTEIVRLHGLGNLVVAGQKNDGVFFSTNHGTTWTEMALCCASVLSVWCDAIGLVYAGTSSDYVSYASSPYNDWIYYGTNLPSAPVMDLYKSPTFLYAATSGNGLWKCSGSIMPWVSTQNGIQDNVIFSLAGNNQKLFAGTASNGVYISVNDGDSWINCSDGLPILSVKSLLITNDYLYAGLQNGGVWRRSLSELTSIYGVSNSVSINVFPNPASDFVVVQLDNADKHYIEVFNTHGQSVYSGMLIDGANKVITKTFESGVYFLKISGAGNLWVEKLIIE